MANKIQYLQCNVCGLFGFGQQGGPHTMNPPKQVGMIMRILHDVLIHYSHGPAALYIPNVVVDQC